MGPRIGTELIIEFGQRRPPECKSVGRCGEVGGHQKGGWGCETFNAGLFIRMVADLPMKLAVLIVGTIEGVEGDQFRRIRREVRRMFLIFALSRDVLDFVRSTVEFGCNKPWTCEGIDKFINLPAPSVQSGGATSKNSVTDRVKLRIRASCIDEFTMISSLFIDKESCHLSECRETSGEVT